MGYFLQNMQYLHFFLSFFKKKKIVILNIVSLHRFKDQFDLPPKEEDMGEYELKNLDNLKYLKNKKNDFFNLIVTSPPYNLNKEYEKRNRIDEYIKEQEKIIGECYRVLSPTGSICWQVGNYVEDGEIFPIDILVYNIFKKKGFKLRNRIIWHFGHGLHASKRFSGRYETILWFTKGDDYDFNLDSVRVPQKWPEKAFTKGPKKGEISSNKKGKNPSDYWNQGRIIKWSKTSETQVWSIPNVKSHHIEKTIHPCQFPIALVELLVKALTKKNSKKKPKVFDPYVGVGSTIIAALKNGCDGYGCDKTKKYIDEARIRINDFKKGKLAIRELFISGRAKRQNNDY